MHRSSQANSLLPSRSLSKTWSVRDSMNDSCHEKQHSISPDYAYKYTRMTSNQLQEETNRPSAQFHDLRTQQNRNELGALRVEVLQCIGLPKLDALGETDAYCLAVCGSYAFRTETIPENADPRWLARMKRACIFPVFKGYAKLYVGVFDEDSETDRDDFAGRVVVDLARLRPSSAYDVMLPLKESSHVYTKRPRGAIRLRIHLTWYNERSMVLSYLPKLMWHSKSPNVTVACGDKKAFQSVALTVHGTHMPGRFSLKLMRAIIREVTLTQITILRYLRVREIRNLRSWKTPLISLYVFSAWMHAVYTNTVRYLPGHVVTFVLLRLWQNYLLYAIDEPFHRGLLPPTFEELFASLLFGRNMITPIEYTPSCRKDCFGMGVPGKEVSTLEGAAAALHEVPTKYRRGRRTFSGCDAVSLLVDKGFANDRREAVAVGKKIMTELSIFEHIGKKNQFQDNQTKFHFMPIRKGKPQTHRPWGASLLWLLGAGQSDDQKSQRATEMPFAPSSEYPRRPLEDAFVPRTKSALPSFSYDSSDDELLDTKTDDGGDSQISLYERGNGQTEEVEHLTKPPPQDIDIKTRADKPVSVVFKELRNKAHWHMFHLYEEKSYVLESGGQCWERQDSKRYQNRMRRATSCGETRRSSTRSLHDFSNRRSSLRHVAGTVRELAQELPSESWEDRQSPRRAKLNSVDFSFAARQNPNSERQPQGRRLRAWSDDDVLLDPDSRRHSWHNQTKRRLSWDGSRNVSNTEADHSKESLDRLLRTGASSCANPWVSKVGVLLQPLLEIAIAMLSFFRSMHNLFTWQDPVLSLWFSLFGVGLVILLHIFPWRLAAFGAGIALVGPQNWAIRLIRERRGIPEDDLDTAKVIARSTPYIQESGPPFTYKKQQSNGSFLNAQAENKYRHVVVPSSQLMFNHRFFDWPPDPQYCQVHRKEGTSVRTKSLFSGNANELESAGAHPTLTFSLASGHYRSKVD